MDRVVKIWIEKTKEQELFAPDMLETIVKALKAGQQAGVQLSHPRAKRLAAKALRCAMRKRGIDSIAIRGKRGTAKLFIWVPSTTRPAARGPRKTAAHRTSGELRDHIAELANQWVESSRELQEGH